MKKNLSVLLLLVVLLSLTACHGNVDMEKFVLPEEFDTSRDYEISFWAKNDTNMTQVSIYQQAIEDFQNLYLPEWSNALCEKRKHLDMLGVGAYDGETLVGLAGCSADCDAEK